MSPNASAMLRITTLSAWAQLHVASTSQSYLENVIKPHKAKLAPLWIAALSDYASIRVDSEFTQESSTVGIDASYSSLGKEVLMPVSEFEIATAILVLTYLVLRGRVAYHTVCSSSRDASRRFIHISRDGRTRAETKWDLGATGAWQGGTNRLLLCPFRFGIRGAFDIVIRIEPYPIITSIGLNLCSTCSQVASSTRILGECTR